MEVETVRAATVLILHGNECVLVSRKDNHADFGLPGGKAEPGETIQAAAVREVYEETGIRLELPFSRFFKMDYRGNSVVTFIVHLKEKVELKTTESGLVRWGSPTEMLGESSFADYNVKMLSYFGFPLQCTDVGEKRCEPTHVTSGPLSPHASESSSHLLLSRCTALDGVQESAHRLNKTFHPDICDS